MGPASTRATLDLQERLSREVGAVVAQHGLKEETERLGEFSLAVLGVCGHVDSSRNTIVGRLLLELRWETEQEFHQLKWEAELRRNIFSRTGDPHRLPEVGERVHVICRADVDQRCQRQRDEGRRGRKGPAFRR